MRDIQPVIEALQNALLQRFGDEVDLIFQYGSHLKGTAHKYSDVDISWAPVRPTTWGSITVMVDDTLFDLYPIHWSNLERMAEFRDVSSTVLLDNRILYQRTEGAGERFRSLAARLRTLQEPAARPDMVRRSMEIFQGAGYDYYLLRTQVEAGHAAGSLKQAHTILRTLLHCLAVCNQAFVDTRKLDQVLALPKLPAGFAVLLDRAVAATAPAELLAATDALMRAVRELLLAEQRTLAHTTTYPAVFDAGYPELKRDLQAIMDACERQDLFALKGCLLSLIHEMSRGIAEVDSGVAYTGFNGLSEYEQDLVRLGFPALLPYMVAGDFAGLHRQCFAFDARLKEFLIERSVKLNNFASVEELQAFLDAGGRSG